MENKWQSTMYCLNRKCIVSNINLSTVFFNFYCGMSCQNILIFKSGIKFALTYIKFIEFSHRNSSFYKSFLRKKKSRIEIEINISSSVSWTLKMKVFLGCFTTVLLTTIIKYVLWIIHLFYLLAVINIPDTYNYLLTRQQ